MEGSQQDGTKIGSDERLKKTQVKKLTSVKKWEMILTIWQNEKHKFTEGVKNNLENRDLANSLYNVQTQTNSLLRAAAQAKQHGILDDLAKLLLLPYNYLEMKDSYVYHYLPGKPRTFSLPLASPSRMWVDRAGEEVVLDTAQFLYLISKAVHLFLDIPKSDRSASMNDLIAKFVPLVMKDHYERWIFDEPGVFQVAGWGCNPGVFNHFKFLEKKLRREFGAARRLSYCNAVTDTDMWILAGVVEMLAAHRRDPVLVPILTDMKEKMAEYIRIGVGLLRSRLTRNQLTDFEGMPATGINFDLGAWGDHPNNEYSGYTGERFPTEKDKKAAGELGWDISHARRFVHVFDTFYDNKQVMGQAFPDQEVMKGLTNQVIYGAFNRDFSKPLFSNFMDGTNGWYEVNYLGRSGFGYAPYDMSIAIITGGYGLWSKYNPDMLKVMDALWKMLESRDPDIALHREMHYESAHYENYARKRTVSFSRVTSWELLNFLSAYETGEE
jgi:hypothetical protein